MLLLSAYRADVCWRQPLPKRAGFGSAAPPAAAPPVAALISLCALVKANVPHLVSDPRVLTSLEDLLIALDAITPNAASDAAPDEPAPATAPVATSGIVPPVATWRYEAGAPYRRMKVEDSLAYLNQVEMTFEDKPEIYNQFLDIMKEFKAQSIDTPGVIERVLQLFHGHRMLILGFNTFLPPGYKIEFSDDQDKPRVQLKYPQGMTGPQPQPYVPPPSASALPVQQAPTHLTGITPAPYGQPLSGPGPEATPPPVPPTQAGSNAAQNTKKAPIEFDQAINYVTKIKKTFEDKPGTYTAPSSGSCARTRRSKDIRASLMSRMSTRRCLVSSRTTPGCSPSSRPSFRTARPRSR